MINKMKLEKHEIGKFGSNRVVRMFRLKGVRSDSRGHDAIVRSAIITKFFEINLSIERY